MTRVDNKSGSHPPAPRSHNAYPGGDHGPGEFHQVRAPAPGQLAQQLGSRVAPTCCVEIRANKMLASAATIDGIPATEVNDVRKVSNISSTASPSDVVVAPRAHDVIVDPEGFVLEVVGIRWVGHVGDVEKRVENVQDFRRVGAEA